MSEKPDNYDLEPMGERRETMGNSTPHSSSEKPVNPLPLEEDNDRPAPPSVRELDVCPSCGSTMRANELVCIRCGFDLKTNKPVETRFGVAEVPDAAVAADARRPMIRSGNGDFWLPIALVAISGFILLVGYLMGLPSLFPKVVATTPEGQAVYVSFLQRLEGLARTFLFVGMLTACSLGAMMFVAVLLGRKTAETFDELKLGTLRLLAIIMTVQLVTLIALRSPGWEWTLETALQIAGFAGLSMALFRLSPRDAGMLAGCTLIALIILWLLAYAVIWGMMPK